MGRKPYKHQNLPPRLRARIRGGKTWYYYDAGGKPRKEIPLGNDYALAVKQWAQLEIDAKPRHPQIITFRYVAERYIREILPTKAPATRKLNLREIEALYKFFDAPPAPIEQIKPIHIRQYLDWRGAQAKIRANREKALFSHIFNKAREWGYTDAPNPCQGIKGFREQGRDVYIEDDAFQAVWQAADWPLRDALDLAYLTGQREADLLKMSETDIRGNILEVCQGKTGKKLRIEITGQLSALLDRIKSHKQAFTIRPLNLLIVGDGRAMNYHTLRGRFDKAREAAAKANPLLANAIRRFRFMDLRAKAATDKSETTTIHAAQRQLGHSTIVMTEHYVRDRKGDKVTPTK
jgi:integrase